MKDIAIHSLQTMVSLVTDGRKQVVQAFSDEIHQFFLDIINLEQEEPEYALIRVMFIEEFQNAIHFIDLTREEAIEYMKETLDYLNIEDFPELITEAIDVSYEI